MISVREEFARLQIAPPQYCRNLTLFPLLRRTTPLPPRDYILLEEGIAQNLVRVTEVHATGSVPELSVTNDATLPVILIDGEELLGSRQNRVLNLSILIPAKHKCVVPVSCVEAGRWRMTSPEFQTADHFLYGSARGQRVSQVTQAMRANGSRLSNQEQIWDELAQKAARLDAPSVTRAVAAIYSRHASSLEEFIRAFQYQELQSGAAFAISGSIVGLDLFDHPDTMQRFFPKLLRSFALDALDTPTSDTAAVSVDALPTFLAAFADAQCFSDNAIGLGKDLRFISPTISGAALYANDRYLHLCAFANSSTSSSGDASQTRLTRSSHRRMFRNFLS
jgi:hypothetical protein